MKARRRGAVVLVATGLVLAVAVPASAQPTGSPPAPQIVTAVARTSTLTMKTGYSNYLFVGGSSASAAITHTSFGHEPAFRGCQTSPKHSQVPVGPSHAASPQASFTTNGNVAALAGVAFSGYTVRPEVPHGDNLIEGCQYPSREPDSFGMGVATNKVGGVMLMLVGTDGVGTLAPALVSPDGSPCQTASGQDPTTLQNVTVSKGQNDGGAVAIFSAILAPHTSCMLDVFGTSYNKPQVGFSTWESAYLLIPDGK